MSFFERAASNVLKATEEITNRMEEGISAILTGELPKSSPDTPSSSYGMPGGDMGEDFEEIEEEFMHSPLEGIADSVLGDLMVNSAKPQGLVEHFHAFRSAITWSEPFILSLLAFQFVMFIICLLVSRRGAGLTPRLVVMVFIAVIVRLAEKMNQLAAKNWEKIATQNYFDRQGIFVAIMFCGPLLFDCLIMLIMFLTEASGLLVKVKTNEMKRKMAERKKKEKPKEE